MSRKRFWLFPVFLCLSAFSLVGCAGVSVTRLDSGSKYDGGVRFYRPAPYLLISNFSTGERQAAIIYLPKKDEEYVLKVHSGLGDVDAKATFDQGWNLTELGDSRRSGSADLLTAIGSLAKTALAAEGALPARGEGLSPGLYAIEFDPATGLASRLRRVQLALEGAK